MSQQAIEILFDRWMNDPTFRVAIRQDPEEAVRRTGVELTQEEWAALHAIDWSLSDEQLQARVNKGM